MDKDYAALLERQAQERADLAKQLEETRPARAAERTRVEQDQPIPPHPPGMTPAPQPQERIYERHLHNLGIEDKRTMGALDQRHGEERAQYDKKRGDDLQRGLDAYGERKHGGAALGGKEDDRRTLEDIRAKMTAEQGREQGTDQGKISNSPPLTDPAGQAHEKVTERKAEADQQRMLEEIRAKMAAAREKDRER